jgi:signal transduction histidine kinase/ligand-binding sensor domain-containing protein
LGVVLGVLACATSGAAETGYSVTTWTYKDGLVASRVIMPITQDRTGYLWVGGATGLLRFDGVRFTRWTTTPPLPSTEVGALCAGRDGSIWAAFGNNAGVAHVRGRDVRIYPSGPHVPTGLRSIMQDSGGTIWIGGATGIAMFRDGVWARVGAAQGAPDRNVHSLYEDPRGRLWVGSGEGIFRREPNETRFQVVDASHTYSGFAPPAFTADATGAVWVTDTEHAIRPLSSAQHAAQTLRLGLDASGASVHRDRRGHTWIATRGQGLLRVESLGSPSARLAERFTVREGLTSNILRTVYEDREGNIWVSAQGGLSRLSESTVKTLDVAIDDDESVFALNTTKDGSIWMATRNGLRQFSNGIWRTFTEADGLPDNLVLAIAADSRDTLYVGTGDGPARLDSGRFVRLPSFPRAPLTQVTALASDGGRGLWLSEVSQGMFHWIDGKLSAFGPSQGQGGGVIFTDSTGRTWMGFNTGAIVSVRDANTVSYAVEEGGTRAAVNAIYEDRQHTIWAGTVTGLFRLDGTRFVTENQSGIADIPVFSIMDDDHGRLWLGTSAGIVRFLKADYDAALRDPTHQLDYQLYDASDGLQGSLARSGSPNAVRSPDGRLWFVSSRGVATIQPDKVRSIGPAPGVHIEDIVVDGAPYGTAPLRLKPGTARVEINYTALTLTASEKVRFRYRLEGFDPTWIDAGKSRQAVYTNLPAGTYRFLVTGHHTGPWSEPAVMAVSVSAPFHQTAWFMILLTAVLALVAGAAWRFRLTHIRRRFSLILAERTRISREIHDTLLQGLIGVALQFDAVSKQLDSDPAAAKERLARARRDAEEYIRETRESIKDLRSPMLRGRDLATSLAELGHHLSGRSSTFEFLAKGPSRASSPRTEEQLLRVGAEAVSNAIRHGRPTTIRMELHYEESAIRLKVTDDGCGFDPSEEDGTREGFGLVSMRERAEQVGGRLTVASTPGAGTQVEFVAPT